MKIASANLQMTSTHFASQEHTVSESLRAWVDTRAADPNGNAPRDTVQLSDAGKAAQKNDAATVGKAEDDGLSADPKWGLIKSLIEALTGKKINLLDLASLAAAQNGEAPPAAARNGDAPAQAGYGVEYDYHERYSETETTTFSANGTVRTADGKEISFQLDLSMSRSFTEQSDVSLRLGDAAKRKDPLVLNFAGTAAQLTDTRFSFDLDADGQAESIPGLAAGSGFLALDRNRDGKINNGSELFGPQSGNGFADLAALDDDRNGWIDEADRAYADLGVWRPDAQGEGSLLSLAQAKVGAIAVNQVATPFDIKDAANQLQGQVRSTGVFLTEEGSAGTVQQVDLAV